METLVPLEGVYRDITLGPFKGVHKNIPLGPFKGVHRDIWPTRRLAPWPGTLPRAASAG